MYVKSAIARSWTITKISFSVIGKDKEMLLFALFGAIASILYVVAIFIPSAVFLVFTNNINYLVQGLELIGNDDLNKAASNDITEADFGFVLFEFVILFVVYVGLAFIAIFFNACVIYTTKIRLEGGDATFMESLRFGLSKIGIIFQWSIISATVGVLLFLLEKIAERVPGIGNMVVYGIRIVLGVMWSITTLFILPVLVYEDVSPAKAIRRSNDILRKTWGESIIGHAGLGLIQFFCILAVVAVTVGMLALNPSEIVIFWILALAIVSLYCISLVFSVAKTVFKTALYVYASTGKEPTAFSSELLAGAIKSKDR